MPCPICCRPAAHCPPGPARPAPLRRATGNDPAYASLQSRFTYSGAGTNCLANDVISTRINNVNGPSTQTSGVDVRLQYQHSVSWGPIDTFAAGMEGTYLIEYQRGAFRLLGAPDTIPVLSAAVDRAGTYDLISAFFSYPRIRGNAFLSVAGDHWSARWQTQYQQGVTPAPGAAGAVSGVITSTGSTVGAGRSGRLVAARSHPALHDALGHRLHPQLPEHPGYRSALRNQPVQLRLHRRESARAGDRNRRASYILETPIHSCDQGPAGLLAGPFFSGSRGCAAGGCRRAAPRWEGASAPSVQAAVLFQFQGPQVAPTGR